MLGNVALLDLGTPELIIILAILLVLFGGKKLPQLTKSIGESVKELRKGFKDEPADQNKKDEKVA
jgi:sec-independent protein translocase protein TatA